MIRLLLAAFAFGVLWVHGAPPAAADDTRPAMLLIDEEGPGTYALRWQTPLRQGATLRLAPRLPPEAQRVDGTYTRALLGDALVETWRITLPGGLAGKEVGMTGPAAAVSSVVVTIRTHAGATHRDVLAGMRTSMTVPEPVRASRPDPGRRVAAAARRGFGAGLGPSHLLLVVMLVLAAGLRALGWPLAAFLGADLLGRAVGGAPPGILAPAGVALAAVLVGREAWRGEARRLPALAGLAGLAWGLGASAGATGVEAVAAALGSDGAHLLVAALAVLVLGRLPERLRRRALAGVGGVLAAALALGAALEQPAPLLAEAGAAPIAPMALVAPDDGGRTRAPTSAVEGLDVFLDIGVFETRVEVHARVDALERWLGLPRADTTLPVAAQRAWLESVRHGVDARIATRLDDAVVQPREVRAGFTTQDAAGVYLRETPVAEVLADAAVGLVLVHPTERIPTRVGVALDGLPAGVVLRARVLDPEVSRDARLTLEAPRLAWTNALRTDPLPAIEAVAVRRLPIRVPLVSLGLVVLGLLLLVLRRRNSVGLRVAALRIALASAALLAGAHAVDLAGVEGRAPAPNAAEQRAITSSLLDNLYRAFNERGEDEVYDRLALSLVGEQLADAYVENRRMLEERRFGGVRTHVDVVALHEWTGGTPEGDGGFRGTATWTVSGTVTHFGHRHWRRNRHEAVLAIGPEAGAWKIRVLDVRAVEREK